MTVHRSFAFPCARAGIAVWATLALYGSPAVGQTSTDSRPTVILHQREPDAPESPAQDIPGLRRQVRALQRDLSARDRELATLQKALEESRRARAELGEASRQLKAQLDDARESEKAALAQARRQEQALEQAMQEAEQMGREMEALATEAETQQAFANEAAREIEALQTLLDQRAEAGTRIDAVPADRADGSLADAHALLAEGKIEEAADLFRQGAARWPDDLAYPVGLASCHYAAGRFAVAGKLLEEILDRDDDQAEAQGLMGLVLWQDDDLRQAERRLSRAVRGQPDNERWLVYLGMVQFARGRAGAAQDSFEEAIRLNPMNPEAHFNLAVLLAARDKPDLVKARVHYEQAQRLGSPPDPELEKRVSSR